MFDQCVMPILDAFNVRLVLSDHWQSADLMQRLRSDQKTKAETYQLKYDDFLAIRTAWYDGRVAMPGPERDFEEFKRSAEQLEDFCRGRPLLKLLVQAMTVREVGRRIVKPAHGSDDVFRAAALLIAFLQDPKSNQPFMYGQAGPSKPVTRSVGSVRSNGQANFGPASQFGSRRSRIDATGMVGNPLGRRK